MSQFIGRKPTVNMAIAGLVISGFLALSPLVIKGNVGVGVVLALASAGIAYFSGRRQGSELIATLRSERDEARAATERVSGEKGQLEQQLGAAQQAALEVPKLLADAKTEGAEAKARELKPKLDELEATVNLLMGGQLLDERRLRAIFTDEQTGNLLATDPRTLVKGETVFVALLDTTTGRQFFRDVPPNVNIEFEGVVMRVQRGAKVVTFGTQDPESRKAGLNSTLKFGEVGEIGRFQGFFDVDMLPVLRMATRFRDMAEPRFLSSTQTSSDEATGERTIMESGRPNFDAPPARRTTGSHAPVEGPRLS